MENATQANLGADIPINGARPEWLKDGEKIGIVWGHERWDNLDTLAEHVYGWEHSIQAIRLPADHPYYLATAKGFTYWAGGESAPVDWDGGEYLYRSGMVSEYSSPDWFWSNRNPKSTWELDIIGYRRKAEPAMADTSTLDPFVADETETEAEFSHGDYAIHLKGGVGFTVGAQYIVRFNGYEYRTIDDDGDNRRFFPDEYRRAKPHELPSATPTITISPITRAEAYEDGLDIATLERLGLLKEETLLERFERENPAFTSDDLRVVEAFIAWSDGR